jgi:hypothetical protein
MRRRSCAFELILMICLVACVQQDNIDDFRRDSWARIQKLTEARFMVAF